MNDHFRAAPPSSAADPAESQVSTRTLVERTRKGDKSAGDKLFSRLIRRLRYWVRSQLPQRVRDLNDTVDVFQDAAAGVWRHLDHIQLEKPGDLEAYVKRAVQNRIKNEAMRVDRRPAPIGLDPKMPGLGPTPLEEALSQERLAQFWAAFEQLTWEDREVLLARHEYKYSYDEVAELLDKPSAAAARMAVNRASARLAELMRTERD